MVFQSWCCNRITIDYITIATTGNAIDFGDLTLSRNPRGVQHQVLFGSGNAASPIGQNNVIDYVTIATLGNAKDFGDMTQIGHSGMSASNLHGGLR